MKKAPPKNKNFDNLLKTSISAVDSIAAEEGQDLSVINDYLCEYLKSFVLLGRVGNIDFFDTAQEEKNNSDK